MYLLVAVLCIVSVLFVHSLLMILNVEPFTPLYLSGPTKCFSCEREMIERHGGDPSFAWMGKQSKCFDCEKQMASIHPNLANLTHGTKCFSCEGQC